MLFYTIYSNNSRRKGNTLSKNKYKSQVEPRLETIRAWKRHGLVDKEIAKNCGVAECTFSTYKNKYPELCEVLKTGKNDAIAQVENALHLRAIGFDYDEVIVIKKKIVLGKGTDDDGSNGTTIERKIIKKKVLPDVAAIIFYLKNRAWEHWRDRKELTGKDGRPIGDIVKSSNVHIILPDNGMNDGDNG